MTTIAVLGAGSWGTTLANLLAHKGQDVRLWAYEEEVVDAVNNRHENTVFLPGAPLAESIRASGDAHEVVAGADVVLSAMPSHAVRSVVAQLHQDVVTDALVVSVTKGIETDTLELMHEVLAECLPGRPIAVLSGPSFAREVYEGQPTAVVAASEQPSHAELAQHVFATPLFRIYTITDVIGVGAGRVAQERDRDRRRGARRAWAWDTTRAPHSSPAVWPRSPGSVRRWGRTRIPSPVWPAWAT